jgi:aryl-alcohol dehydrogenase-like predicted oxidoreductase
VLTRRLGRTGHHSSLAVLGAAAFWDSTVEATRAAFLSALAAGVNHVDIAPAYGAAERLAGPLIGEHRDQLFVACKTGRHSRDGVRAQLEESLVLLGCDRFDLYQAHGVVSLDDLSSRADAFAAIVAARDEGLARFIGITGHELTTPVAQAEALRRYDLDTVMFPVNARLWAEPDYRRDAEALLELAAERDVGVMAIKACAARPWGKDRPPGERSATTWYEPYTAEPDIDRGVRFTLSVPGVHAFCTPGDVGVLPTAIAAAERFEPIDLEPAIAASTSNAALIFPMPRN